MSDTPRNQQIVLAARPKGELKETDFKQVDVPMPSIGEGEVLVQSRFLAVEPAMKGWMEARVDYTAPIELGGVMRGWGNGIIAESNNPDFLVGTPVSGMLGWQRYVASNGKNIPLQPLPDGVSPPVALNVLGITGLTAWFGMNDIGKPKAGQTVLVSGAAGATGSVAGQLARIAGARVVGIAGGKEKCDWLVAELGFDAAIDYKNEALATRIKELCPQGIDVYYDNVGGEMLDIALANLADYARVVLCGGISRYNKTGKIPGPVNYFNLVYRKARMEGFIVGQFAPRFGEALQSLTGHLKSGELRGRETILVGFDQLPRALMNLFTGDNIGKQMVAVDVDGKVGVDTGADV
ncbi:MAG: NADPH-dependent curcumin reductase CurA [Bacteroidia bacterium]